MQGGHPQQLLAVQGPEHMTAANPSRSLDLAEGRAGDDDGVHLLGRPVVHHRSLHAVPGCSHALPAPPHPQPCDQASPPAQAAHSLQCAARMASWQQSLHPMPLDPRGPSAHHLALVGC